MEGPSLYSLQDPLPNRPWLSSRPEAAFCHGFAVFACLSRLESRVGARRVRHSDQSLSSGDRMQELGPKRRERVAWSSQDPRPELELRETTGSPHLPRGPGHREPGSAELPRMSRSVACSTSKPGFHHDEEVTERGEAGVPSEEVVTARRDVGRKQGDVAAPAPEHVVEQAAVLCRVGAADPRCRDDDGEPPDPQRPAVRGRVDTFGATRDDGAALGGEPRREVLGVLVALGGRPPGPHDGDEGQARQLAAHEELCRRLGQIVQARWKGGAGEPARFEERSERGHELWSASREAQLLAGCIPAGGLRTGPRAIVTSRRRGPRPHLGLESL